MTKHADDDPVILEYSSNKNITFHGTVETGYTWGDWREMSRDEQTEAIDGVVYDRLIDINVAEDEG